MGTTCPRWEHLSAPTSPVEPDLALGTGEFTGPWYNSPVVAGHLEVEDKYDVDGDAVLTDLDRLPAVAVVAPPVDHQLEATYFDTADLALVRAGVTLRRRSGGEDAGWHLKLPGAKGRHELHEPLDGQQVPASLGDVTAGLAAGQPLVAVVELRTKRTVHRLLDAHGDVLADVADDRVTALRAGSADPPRAWREWEIELVGGGDDLLAAAAEHLRGLGARPAAVASKLARALGPDRPAPPQVQWPGAQDQARMLVSARLAQQVDVLRRLDPAVRADLPDSVHRMRIAARRVRTALATYRPLLDRALTEPIRTELRWLGGELGPARDAEVQRARLRGAIGSLRADEPGLLRGNVRTRTDAELTASRERAHARALTALRSERYSTLLDDLDGLVSDPPLSDRAHAKVHEVARGRVRHDYKRLAGRVDTALAVTDPRRRAEALHEARKAARRARYAAEPLVAAYGRPAKRFVKAMKRVASSLGEHHDAVVADRVLRDLARSAASAGHDAFTYGVLQSGQARQAENQLERFERVWRKARRKKLRRWLR